MQVPHSQHACMKCIASRSITTHRISAQSVQLFPKYGKGAHLQKQVPIHGLCNTQLVGPYTQILNFSSLRSRDTERSKHVRSPFLVCVKRVANWSLSHTPNFGIILLAVPGIRKAGVHSHAYQGTCNCRCIPRMICVICITTWYLTTHQIWSQLPTHS